MLARFENWVLLAKKVIEVEFPSYSIMANLARATSLASKMKLGGFLLPRNITPMTFGILPTAITHVTMPGPGKNLSPNLLFGLCIIYAVFGSHGTVILGYSSKLNS